MVRTLAAAATLPAHLSEGVFRRCRSDGGGSKRRSVVDVPRQVWYLFVGQQSQEAAQEGEPLGPFSSLPPFP